jgi:hypothetical protein
MAAEDAPRLFGGERRLDEHEQVIVQLQIDMAAMRAKLAETATREDVVKMGASLGAKIDAGINGLLRDALNSVPAKYSATWHAVAAFVAAVGVPLAIASVLVLMLRH